MKKIAYRCTDHLAGNWGPGLISLLVVSLCFANATSATLLKNEGFIHSPIMGEVDNPIFIGKEAEGNEKLFAPEADVLLISGTVTSATDGGPCPESTCW